MSIKAVLPELGGRELRALGFKDSTSGFAMAAVNRSFNSFASLASPTLPPEIPHPHLPHPHQVGTGSPPPAPHRTFKARRVGIRSLALPHVAIVVEALAERHRARGAQATCEVGAWLSRWCYLAGILGGYVHQDELFQYSCLTSTERGPF